MNEDSVKTKNFSLLTSLFSILNNNESEETYFVLAKYMLEHFYEIEHMSIYQIAQECYVSRSSVQRFLKAIGFDTFSALKYSYSYSKSHYTAYISYADYPNYPEHLYGSLTSMMKDINTALQRSSLATLARKIHDATTVVILATNQSSSTTLAFQESMIAFGKVIRIMTNTTANMELLDLLTKDDLLIVSSVSGNFGLAVNDDVKCLPCTKCLITINSSEQLIRSYDMVYFLSNNTVTRDTIGAQRTSLTRYGALYFFDLLYNQYVQLYKNDI